MTNLDKLRTLGEALYGARWMRAVARDLNVNYRTVLRWDAGEFAPSDGVISDLISHAIRRGIKINEAVKCSTVT